MAFKNRVKKSIALALVGITITTPILNHVNAMESNKDIFISENENLDMREVYSDESIKLMKITIIFLIFNSLLTLAAIDRGKEYEQSIPPSNKFEEVLDKHFGVNYLNNMFNNRWNKK